MRRSLRLLPITMLVAFLLLGLKVGEVMRDGRLLVLSFASEARAQQEGAKKEEAKKEEAKKDESKKEEKKDEPKKEEGKKEEGKKDEGKKEEGKKDETKKEGDTKTEGEEDDEDAAPKHEFTQVEVDILQSLAKRRQELDDWAKQIQLKENMLIATEQRINDKIDSLQKMKKELETLLALYNEQEDTKIRSLVKIYENMKPKDSARIFEELDMPVLLTVVDKMSERKVSPILAAMNPTKAKDLTIQLAEQRKLRKPTAASAAPPAAAPAAAK